MRGIYPAEQRLPETKWDPADLPADVEADARRWERFDTIRSRIGVVGFLLLLMAVVSLA